MKPLELSDAGLDKGGGPNPDASSGDDLPDVVFGRYRLLRRIGKGGMAEAFLAVLEGSNGFRRRCVVKRIRPDKAASTYFTQMFVDEARITAALHHPNIVQAYEFGEVGNLYYLTMEYLDGRNLSAMLDGLHGRGLLMPISMAAHIVQQVARGLHYAHKLTDDDGVGLGVIHRDVSPSNVMLLRTGEVKLLDFGVAKAERALKQGATVVGKVKGKLSYMAPEQHSGKAVDLRADVFALGVMLWEMLTGELLFSGDNGGERSRKMMRGQVPVPSTLRHKVPPALDAMVLRCLKVQPDDRYPSAGALADDLGAFVRAALFDPAELEALVCEYAAEEQPEVSASGSVSSDVRPAIDSRAIITREDSRSEHPDLDLMAATTSRERARPIVLAAAPVADAEEPSPAPGPRAFPRTRRFWPVAVAVAVAVAVTVLMIPRRSIITAPYPGAARRGAEILLVPAPAPTASATARSPELPPPVSSEPPVEGRATDPSGPPRPTTRSVTGRRRPRAAEAKPDSILPPALPTGPAAHELRLANPF